MRHATKLLRGTISVPIAHETTRQIATLFRLRKKRGTIDSLAASPLHRTVNVTFDPSDRRHFASWPSTTFFLRTRTSHCQTARGERHHHRYFIRNPNLIGYFLSLNNTTFFPMNVISNKKTKRNSEIMRRIMLGTQPTVLCSRRTIDGG